MGLTRQTRLENPEFGPPICVAVRTIVAMRIFRDAVLDTTQFGKYPTHIGGDNHLSVPGTMNEISLSNALFSNVQKRLLALIFGRPDRSFYTSEIVRNMRSGTGAVARELSRLQRSGLVSVEKIGNQKHYRANRESPIFNELHSLVQKTIGLKEPLRQSLEPYADRITSAFVYGSVAKQTDTARSDIDLMVIAENLAYSDLYPGLQNAESVLSRPVNPTILEIEEWRRKRAQKNSFIEKISNQPKIFVFGSEADLAT
jgi:predicted nucleotidyltransferase